MNPCPPPHPNQTETLLSDSADMQPCLVTARRSSLGGGNGKIVHVGGDLICQVEPSGEVCNKYTSSEHIYSSLVSLKSGCDE